MNSELRIGLLVLIINTIIAFIYLIVNLVFKKEKTGSYRMRFFVMLLCPVVGPLFFLFGWIIYKIFMNDPVDLEDVVFSKERVKTYRKADEVRERNIVPMEEAMAVSDRSSTRELMLDLVRKDISESLHTIALALNSSDSEVSHYAASVLQETLNNFRNSVQKLYTTILELREEEGHDAEIIAYSEELIGDLNTILKQNVLSPMEQKTYAEQMEEVVSILCLYKTPEPELLASLCMRFFEIQDYVKCEAWSDRLMELYPDVLASYTCKLKLYYTVNDRENFFAVMDALKHSEVIVDNETLEMIRTFS